MFGRANSFARRQALHDLDQAAASLRAQKASPKCVAPLETVANALRADTPLTPDADWGRLSALLGTAPRPVRAALANGLRELHWNTSDAPPAIPRDAYLSRDKSAVDAALLPLARRLTPDLCGIIALADYGYQSDDHKKALRLMCDTDFRHVPLQDRWTPMEVIELTSHSPDEPGHLPCLAIVFLDAVRSGDAHGTVAFRWENQYAHIKALPEADRAPLCAAVRFLFESGDLDDLFRMGWKRRLPDGALLPFG